MSLWLRHIGAVLQGIVLGLLLVHAVVSLSAIGEGVRIFRYQGF
jgi:hypothetical protein